MMKRGKGKNSKLLPNSFRIISSCIKNVSTNASTAVRNAGASVAASISSSDDHKDQVNWAGFDKLEFNSGASKHVLLLGYQNGFQVIDVEDASNFNELVSKRTGPVTFLQMLPPPLNYDGTDKLKLSRPILVIVGGDEEQRTNLNPNQSYLTRPVKDSTIGTHFGNQVNLPTVVQFYSFRSNSYEEVIRFQSAVLMVRCSPRIIAVGLEAQIYCYNALTLEKKFSVLTYPVPNIEEQRSTRITSCGPMALGPRWLAYAPNCPMLSNAGRLSPKNMSPSGLTQSQSQGNGSLMAHYAMESSKQLAAGIIGLGDMGYKTFSKYCGDMLPDGHSSPGWKVGKLTSSEMENAGMVIVKDVVSTEVISQFRAHTSPISALSFDESGTLLVTASVHGNSLNIYRIMPSSTRSSSSHVHLYKLYRGITKAIIQDIHFSNNSQWITIVSSKGTCHIYVLSPYGGEAGLQTLPNGEGTSTITYPVTYLPWWSTSSFTVNQQYSLPPPPLTLSVVSRIRNNASGIISTVSNVASSAIGKTLVPSGAVVSVFHNCIPKNSQDRPLEHLLVYTPSGYVIQYKLFPSMGELSNSSSKTRSGTHEEELSVKAEPIQWWDVCRNSDSPEREEGTNFELTEKANNFKTLLPEKSEENESVNSNSVKPLDRSHWYLSNAEVHLNSDRLPIWQKSKLRFHVMSTLRREYHVDGEFEIEKIPCYELEIKQKDLLPVFSHFHSANLGWMNRGASDGNYPNQSSLETCKSGDKVNEAIVICHSDPASLGSTESSDAGSSNRIENLLDFDQINIEKSPTRGGHVWNEFYEENNGNTNLEAYARKQKSKNTELIPSEYSNSIGNHNISYIENKSVSKESQVSIAKDTNNLEDVSSSSGVNAEVDFKQYFQDDYCDASEGGGMK